MDGLLGWVKDNINYFLAKVYISNNDDLVFKVKKDTINIICNDIKVEIKGFHDDSEQTWNSTGLTLWRSSHYLCQYLLSEEYKTLQKDNHIRVLELGSGLGRKVRAYCFVVCYSVFNMKAW